MATVSWRSADNWRGVVVVEPAAGFVPAVFLAMPGWGPCLLCNLHRVCVGGAEWFWLAVQYKQNGFVRVSFVERGVDCNLFWGMWNHFCYTEKMLRIKRAMNNVSNSRLAAKAGTISDQTRVSRSTTRRCISLVLWCWMITFVAVRRRGKLCFLIWLVCSLWMKFALIRLRPAPIFSKHLLWVRVWEKLPVEIWSL